MIDEKRLAKAPNLAQKLILFISLLIIPLTEGFGLSGPFLRDIFIYTQRPAYWGFLTSIILFHWLSVGLIFWVTLPRFAKSLNIRVSYFYEKRFYLIALILAAITLSVIAPGYLYSGTLPGHSITLSFLGPVSVVERLGFVFLAVTAGICEEVIFRGYGITMLEKWTSKNLALVVSSIAFMSIHGLAFMPWFFLVQYFIIGIILGAIYQKYRRLEVLIIVHIFLDILVVTLP